MGILEILNKKHTSELLLKIYDNPRCIQDQLANKSEPGSGAKRNRLAELVEVGLIETGKSPSNWSAITYFLTPEGERICKHLRAIENGTDVIETTHCAPEVEGRKMRS